MTHFDGNPGGISSLKAAECWDLSKFQSYTVSQRKLYYFKSKLDGENTLVHKKITDFYNLLVPKFVH